jgi:hypothetical protein
MKKSFAALMALAFVLAGCTTDITKHPSSHTDFIVGQVYQLKKPVYLWGGKLMLIRSENPPANSEGVFAIGTTFVVRKVQVFRGPEVGTVTDVFAEVLSGQYKGMTVNITWVSNDLSTGYTKRDPDTLEPVEQAPK